MSNPEGDEGLHWRHSTAQWSWDFLNASGSAPVQVLFAAAAYRFFTTGLLIALFFGDTGSPASRDKATSTSAFFTGLEITAVLVFAAEYALRLYSCVEDAETGRPRTFTDRWNKRLWTALQPIMLLEALSIVALIIDLCTSVPAPNVASGERGPRDDRHEGGSRVKGLSALRLLRLLTIVRVERHFVFFRPVLDIFVEKRVELATTMGIASILLLTASSAMYYIESPDNPEFESMLDALWWGTAALTTVGYGDITPRTGWGKFLAAVTAFVGVGLFALPTGIIASGLQDAMKVKGHALAGHNAIWFGGTSETLAGAARSSLAAPLNARLTLPPASLGGAHGIAGVAGLGVGEASVPKDRMDEVCGRLGYLEVEVAALRTDIHRIMGLLENRPRQIEMTT